VESLMLPSQPGLVPVTGNADWENDVPAFVIKRIKARELFGYTRQNE